MTYDPFTVIDGDGAEEQEHKADEPSLINFDTGDDMSWFDPNDPGSVGLQLLIRARILGVYDYIDVVPGLKELSDAADKLSEAIILLHDKYLADHAADSCLNCKFYHHKVCLYWDERYKDVAPCDVWSPREEGWVE